MTTERPAPTRSPALSQVVHALGPTTVEVVNPITPSDGPEPEVTGARIYDPADPAAIGPGELVLGVNIGMDAADAAIREAAMAGAAGIALKGPVAELARLVGLATSCGLALLAVADEVTWDQLYTLIRNAASKPGAVIDEAGEAPLGDLFALANALAAHIGGAVTIEDPGSTVLAYSNLDQPIDDARRDTILGRRTPGNWATRLEEEGFSAQLLRSSEEVLFVHDPRAEARDRLVTCIRAGAEILGTIWVVEGDQPLDDGARAALRESAPLAALHLLRHQASGDLTRQQRASLFNGLLQGERPAAEAAAGLGVDSQSPCAVVGFHLAVTAEIDLVVKRSRAVDLVLLTCESFRRRVACVGIGQTVYALFPSVTPEIEANLDRFIADIAKQASDVLGTQVVAGIGTTVPSLDAVQASRHEADRVIRVLTSVKSHVSPVARIEDVRAQSILIELGDLLRQRPELRLPSLELVAAYDHKHSKDYVATLLALAENSWDISEAANQLHVHPNSVRYRMKRLGEIARLDLGDSRLRLLVSLQLLTP